MAVAGVIAAGAVGAAALARGGDDAPAPSVTARETRDRTADDALLDAIDQGFAAHRVRAPTRAAQREFRDWIAERFGTSRDAPLLP